MIAILIGFFVVALLYELAYLVLAVVGVCLGVVIAPVAAIASAASKPSATADKPSSRGIWKALGLLWLIGFVGQHWQWVLVCVVAIALLAAAAGLILLIRKGIRYNPYLFVPLLITSVPLGTVVYMIVRLTFAERH